MLTLSRATASLILVNRTSDCYSTLVGCRPMQRDLYWLSYDGLGRSL
jgi:hypothetical protein